MKKLLFFLLFPFALNAQITLTGSSLVGSSYCSGGSINQTYGLSGSFNGKDRYVYSFSGQYGVGCEFIVRWNTTNSAWELVNRFQSGPSSFDEVLLGSVSSNTNSPPCGTAFGGTITGASCSQNCTNSMTVSGSSTICSGASTSLSATGCLGTVTWNNGVGTGTNINVSPATTTTYTATCSTAGVCTGAATVTVINPPVPQIVAIENANGGASGTNISICAGSSIQLYCGGCTAIDNSSINWSNGTTSTGTSNTSSSFVPVVSTTYYATRTANGCTSISSNVVSVTVNPKVQVSATNSTICSGSSTTLSATGCSGTISWSNGATGSSINVSPTSNTTYTATCSTVNTCAGTAIITVTTTPTAPIITTSTPTLCSGSTATLSYNFCSVGSVLWSNGSSGNSLSVTSNGTFTASCVNGTCVSSASNSITVTFHSTPNISGTTCVGSTLTATGFGSAPLQWFKDGIELTGATAATYVPTQTGSYQVATTAPKGAWNSLTSPSNQALNGVHFVDAYTGWVAGDGGKIYKTINAGTSWVLQTSGISTNIKDIYFTSALQGYAVGSGGKILKTIDGGSNWTTQTTNTTNDLYDVFFLNAATGWAVGGKFIVLKTTDSGATWTTTSIENAATNSDYYSQVQFIDATTGYVSGGNSDFSEGFVKKSIDGGTTWTNSYLSSMIPGVFMYGLSFIDANNGWVGGAVQGLSPYAHKTINAGSSWNSLSFAGLSLSNPIRSVQFVDANRGWMIASSSDMGYKMLSTSDGGATFSKDVITNETQITSVAIGKKLFMFPDGNSGWMVGANITYGNGYIMKFSNKVCISTAVSITPGATVPTLNQTGTQTLCPNASINLTASGCSGTVTWSNASTGSTLSVTQAGTYSATCTTSCGPSAASSQLVVVTVTLTLPLSGTATNGTQQAGQQITSTQTVNAGTNITYRAGNSVLLNPTFQTQSGAIFKAEIGGCN